MANKADKLQRVKELSTAYEKSFSNPPDCIVVAPGRVNLIGEHVDHQGYPVVPIACSLSVRLAAGRVAQGTCEGNGLLRVVHARNPVDFREKTFTTLEHFFLDKEHHWTDYVVCAFWGLIGFSLSASWTSTRFVRGDPVTNGEWLNEARRCLQNNSLLLIVDGDLPLASGLSSSSALTVAALAALSRCIGISMTRKDVALVATHAERYAGTAGGGMDQATICFSQAQCAQLIRFHPLQTEAINLPEETVIVVCHSGCTSHKAVDAAVCYNKRVFELVLASFLLLSETPHWKDTDNDRLPHLTLREVQERLERSFSQMIETASQRISAQPYSKEQVQMLLGTERLDKILDTRVGREVWERNTAFEPLRRTLHVFSEAQRVDDFVRLCRSSKYSPHEKLQKLGEILNASDASLADYFDCSTRELAGLTNAARSFGAYGARLVGAGWGGCILALVPKRGAPAFLTSMQNYAATSLGKPTAPGPSSAFIVYPDTGVTVYGSSLLDVEWA